MERKEPAPNAEIQLNNALKQAAMMRLKGRDMEYIYNELINLGFSAEIVALVMNALTTENKKEVKSKGMIEIIIGAAILILGIGISVISYWLMRGSGSFIVAIGSIATGIFLITKGVKKALLIKPFH